MALIRYLITIFCLALANPIHAGIFDGLFGGHSELTRQEAENIFNKQVGSDILIRIVSNTRSKDGNVLLEKQYLFKPNTYGPLLKPTSSLSPYLVEFNKGGIARDAFVILHYGNINYVKATGITSMGENIRKVEFDLTLSPNEIGQLFETRNSIPLAVEYQLYDDGWRFKNINFHGSKELSKWNKNYLYGIGTSEATTNAILWNMHIGKEESFGGYPHFSLIQGMVEDLYKTNSYQYLDTVAWVYLDNNFASKAIETYEKKTLPTVREVGGPETIKTYEEYFVKLKKNALLPEMLREDIGLGETNVDTIKLSFSAGADPNTIYDYWGFSVLSMAVNRDNYELAKCIIEAGADVNIRDTHSGKGTPLHMAKSIKIVELLLKNGADMTLKDSRGETAKDRVCFSVGLNPELSEDLISCP